MKNKLMIISIASMMIITIIGCKKKKSHQEAPICQENRHFEGKYVGTNAWQKDTIQIIFNNMNENCLKVMTIRGFGKSYNRGGCNQIADKDYEIIGNKITATNSDILDNVWSANGITNDNDISIIACNGGSFNYKKIK